MVLDAVSNFVRGNTDAEVGTEDTTVSVDDASIFPDPSSDGEFNVVIWDVNNFPRPDQDGDVEIMRVTARDTDTNELTVTRAQEMTSAAAHPEGSAIHLSPTAKMFSDIESTFSDFWDATAQELTADVNNTNTTTTALEAESVSTEVLGTDLIFAAAFPGADADARLTNAISEASNYQTIYLESDVQYGDFTINKPLKFVGSSREISDNGSMIGDWTLNNTSTLVDIQVRENEEDTSAELTINNRATQLKNVSVKRDADITVSSNRVLIIGCGGGGAVTFDDDTSNGAIGITDGNLSVTDNGNNKIL